MSRFHEVKESEVAQSCPILCDPIDCSLPAPLSVGFPGKSTGVGYRFLHHGIFWFQGLNPGPSHYRQILLLSEPPGKGMSLNAVSSVIRRFFLFIYLAAACSARDLHSLTRDRIYVPCTEIFGVPTTGLPENFLESYYWTISFWPPPPYPHQLIPKASGVVYSKLIVMFFQTQSCFAVEFPIWHHLS